MRVTFVHSTTNDASGGRIVAEYAQRLIARGHHVTLVTGRDPRPRPLRAIIDRFRGHRSGVYEGRDWLDDVDVPHITVDRAGPIGSDDLPNADVVVATWWETAEWIARLPARKGAPAYFLQGVDWTLENMPVERVRQTWRLPLHKIVATDFLASIARDEFGDGDISYVPTAVDLGMFNAPPRDRRTPPTVGLMLSDPTVTGGGDITYAALHEAKRRLPELRGLAFGTTPPAERPVPRWVDIVISRAPEARAALYAKCDVFIRGARDEGFGPRLLEVMACRTPVVATPAGVAPELLPNGGGIVVPYDDEVAMAEAIVDVCTLGPAGWKLRSDRAYHRATSYSWHDATDRMEAALERAAQKSEAHGYTRASAVSTVPPPPNDAPPAAYVNGVERAARYTPFAHHALGIVRCHEPTLAAAMREARVIGIDAPWLTVARDPNSTWLAPVAAGESVAALAAALSSPSTVAAIEDRVRNRRLLRDPLCREEGLLRVRGVGSALSTGEIYQTEPPLVRRWTALMPLSHGILEMWDPHAQRCHVVHARPGEGLLIAAGLDRPLGLRPFAAGEPFDMLLVHYHQAEDFPDVFPRITNHTFQRDGVRFARPIVKTLADATTLAKRQTARLRERFMGLH